MKPWWGVKTLKSQEIVQWSIKDRFVALQKGLKEWTIYNFETPNEQNSDVIYKIVKDKQQLVNATATRFVLPPHVNSVLVEPSLADRAMIVKPSNPLLIMPDESIKVFISTPLWITILYEEKDLPLLDVPFWRPSDSWFGKNTMHGDLCYAKYTDAALSIREANPRSHRAITSVTIVNKQSTPLSIERLNLPTPKLKVYVDEAGQFWSEDLIIEQKTEHGAPVSEVKHKVPEHNSGLTLVSQSRVASNKSSLLSTLKNLVA